MRFFVLLLLCFSSAIASEHRQWTLRGGKKLPGKLQYVRESQVFIQRSDNSMVRVDLRALQQSDQSWITTWTKQQGGDLQFASWIKVTDKAFQHPWPRIVHGPPHPKVKFLATESKKGHYIFESPHYRFISDSKLNATLVSRFATLFETTYRYNLKLPLNCSGHHHPKGHKFQIQLVGSYADYVRMGGPNGSAGVYTPSTKVILVPLSSLGLVKKGTKWALSGKQPNNVLAHEITHQLMDGVLFTPWFIEGSAEYVAATRYTHGTYHVYSGKNHVFRYVASTKMSHAAGRALGRKVDMPSLKTFMTMDYQRFTRQNANRNYGMALLLTYYFYHVDGRGDAAQIKQYVKAIQRGVSPQEAQKKLLNGRSYAELEKSFKKYCAQNGVTVNFSSQ